MDDAETRLVAARAQRVIARATLRTDLTTLQVGTRARLNTGLIDTYHAGISAVRENKAVIALGALGIAGWLFRKPLVRLTARSVALARRAIARRSARQRLRSNWNHLIKRLKFMANR